MMGDPHPTTRPPRWTVARSVLSAAVFTLIGCGSSGAPGPSDAPTPGPAVDVPTPDTITLGRAAIDALEFEPLDFQQPEVETHRVDGVDVLVLEDHALPLVTAYAYFRGGYGLFDREDYAAATGLPALMRYGGTMHRSPDEVDEIIDDHALLLSFGSGGGSVTSSINTLALTLEPALELWGEMLSEPGFHEAETAAWRARQLQSVLRRVDDPGLLAFSELNRLLYGDHPIGWEMTEADLEPNRLTPERLRAVHERVACRDNLVLGLTGDVSWDAVRPLVQTLLDRIPPCATSLPEAPIPDIRRQAGVFLIEKELDQAVIVMAHPTSVRLGDEDAYYAAMIGNSILGGGGFSSRILGRVRTEEGYAYSAASLWTTPRRHDGIIGATTRTRPENVVPAIEVILETMTGLRADPPTPDEVNTTVDRIVNGFVFNFDTPGQIVARSMAYLAQDLPEDWLERYWSGVQEVRAEDVQQVFAEHLHPERMSILVVGDPERIGREALARLGPVTVLDVP